MSSTKAQHFVFNYIFSCWRASNKLSGKVTVDAFMLKDIQILDSHIAVRNLRGEPTLA